MARYMEISGRTKIVAHLSHPAHHLRTPPLFNARCAERGIDAVLVPCDVSPDDLRDCMAGLKTIRSLAGALVTVPHKATAAALCDDLVGDALELDVCNVIRRAEGGRMIGAAFDGAGFVSGLKQAGHTVEGRMITLIGAGGAGAAIALALCREEPSRFTILNRTRTKADELADRLRAHHKDFEIRTDAQFSENSDIIINATSLGLNESDPFPLDPDQISPETIVADIVMQPDVTPLLAAAAERGAIIHKGVHMITTQIDHLIDFLFAEANARFNNNGDQGRA